jgi:chromate transporter
VSDQSVGLGTVAAQWLRIGVTGFGGPPAHIALLRRLCVQRKGWLSEDEFADGIAATNLLPGPASTQLAIYCAWRVRGVLGAVVGGLCFIVPGLIVILALASVLLGAHPSRLVLGAAAGAGAAVAAVAVHAAAGLVPASWQRTPSHARWVGYAAAGAIAPVLIGAWVVVILLACGLVEVGVHRRVAASLFFPVGLAGGLGSLCWVAFKVGALSYGGGFVIIPLMQHDAVQSYHWMTASEFLYAVALGQITPGPVVQTVAVVGYAAGGIAGGLLASAVAFAPSFVFVLAGARHFDRLRTNTSVQAFLTGAGPAAIGAIAGSSVLLAFSIAHLWQLGVLALATLWLLILKRGVVSALLGAGAVGLVAALLGWPVN